MPRETTGKPKLLFPALLLIALMAAGADVSPEALQEGGHWKQLRKIAEPRVAANPKDAQAVYLLSRVKEAFGDVDAALTLAEQAVSLDPGNASYHLQLGVLNGKKAAKASFFSAMKFVGRYKAEMQKAIDLDGKNIEARWELMEFHIHAPGIAGGDKQKAHTLADEILRLNATRGNLALAEIAEANKQQTDVENYLRKAAEADPRNYSAQMAPAWFYLSEEQKKYDVAEKYARQALALDPGRSSSYSALIRIYVRQERWKELDAILVQAEKNVPDDLSPYFHAGRELLLTEKDFPRAERYFRKYLSQEAEGHAPPLSRAHWRLGQALEKEGCKAEAIAELETAVRLEPTLDQAKKDLQRIK
jgi:tetratricopeptide (TPR) repeat protein